MAASVSASILLAKVPKECNGRLLSPNIFYVYSSLALVRFILLPNLTILGTSLNGIIQYLCLDWLISLNKVFSTFIHVACIITPFLRLNNPLYAYHILFIHLFVIGQTLVWLPPYGFCKQCCLNMGVLRYLWAPYYIITYFEHILKSGITGLYSKFIFVF